MSKKYIGVLTVSIASSFICKRTLTHTLISPKPRFGDCSWDDVYSSLVLLFLCCIRNTGGGSLFLLCQVNQIAHNSLFQMPSKLVFAGSRRLIILHENNTSRIQIHMIIFRIEDTEASYHVIKLWLRYPWQWGGVKKQSCSTFNEHAVIYDTFGSNEDLTRS